jgi:DNA-3-methyladenine glycosylase II
MLGLAPDRVFPFEPKPRQILQNRDLELRAAAAAVNVLDPQYEPSALLSRRAPGKESRMSMTEVKQARGARRKTGGERIHDGAPDLRESSARGNPPRDRGLIALAELAARDADIAAAWAIVGDPPPRRRPKGFPGLIGSVVAQQVSAASARAIWTRLNAAGPLTPEWFLGLSDADLRVIGFSRGKMLYARGLAEAIVSGKLNFRRLHRLPDEQAISELMELKGIGRWTAEVYLLFGLQRLDVWPADDLALQVAVQKLKGLAERPNRLALVAIAEPWRPWRGVAARFLWHYYHRTGRNDDPTPTQG